jgi:hypothetical protein
MNNSAFATLAIEYCDPHFASYSADPLTDMEISVANIASAKTSHLRKKWFNVALAFFNEFPAVREVWNYLENVRLYAERFVKKVADVVRDAVENILPPRMRIEWNGIEQMPKGVQQGYLIRLLDRNKQLIWSKVGTTTDKTGVRMTQHLRYYKKDGVRFVEVVRLWDCNGLDAEGLESMFRAHYIRKHPGTFRKNDRFTGVEFDLEEADRLMENYLGNRA